MQHLFLNKDLSLLAKEKGFDEPCFAHYIAEELRVGFKFNHPDHNRNSIAKLQYGNEPFVFAPLYQQIIDWFREKHRLDIMVRCLSSDGNSYYKISKLYDDGNIKGYSNFGKSYYAIYNKAIEEAFKLI